MKFNNFNSEILSKKVKDGTQSVNQRKYSRTLMKQTNSAKALFTKLNFQLH